MRFPRLPDWTIYTALVAGLLFAAIGRREDADAPAAPPPPPVAEAPRPTPPAPDGPALGAPTDFDEAVTVEVEDRQQEGIGTAFSVDRGGAWLTARHVIDGCTRTVLVTDRGRGVATRTWIDPNADVAVVTTLGGSVAVPLETGRPLRIGERAFHIGFPQGQPGEVTSRLLGRATLDVQGRGARREGLLAWAETGRTEGLKGSLGGLSGGPAFDAAGRVIGITVAESPRRGRIYTAAPESMAEAVRVRIGPVRRGVAPVDPPTVENYGRVGDALRRDLRVALIACVEV